MTRGIPSIRHAELVYSWGWPAATGGLTLSTGEAGEYGEAYDTDVWDSMLTVIPAATHPCHWAWYQALLHCHVFQLQRVADRKSVV